MSSISLNGVIRNGRVEVDEPIDLPDGTEVVVTAEPMGADDGPMPPEEIARVLAAMQRLQPLEIPDDVAADLDTWELGSSNRSRPATGLTRSCGC